MGDLRKHFSKSLLRNVPTEDFLPRLHKLSIKTMSQDINCLRQQPLVLPEHLPHTSDHVKAWKPNIADARFGPNMS